MSDSLCAAARRCLDANEPADKLRLTQQATADWRAGRLAMDCSTALEPGCKAGLPAALRLVRPRDLPRRRINSELGRAALVHAVAHIEFNAINLAWDAVYRFRDLPADYYSDWIQVASEEALHFELLHEHLQSLGYRYGDMPAHNGLWQMAQKTASDPLLRMALVPRVLEARGLDVTPGMIERFRAVGDERGVAILERILADEVGHVAIGTRWYRYLCEQRDLEPSSTYMALYQQHYGSHVAGPLNHTARCEAGFDDQELGFLEDLAATNR